MLNQGHSDRDRSYPGTTEGVRAYIARVDRYMLAGDRLNGNDRSETGRQKVLNSENHPVAFYLVLMKVLKRQTQNQQKNIANLDQLTLYQEANFDKVRLAMTRTDLKYRSLCVLTENESCNHLFFDQYN